MVSKCVEVTKETIEYFPGLVMRPRVEIGNGRQDKE